MEFTDGELAVIAKAKKKVGEAFVVRILIVVVMLVGIALMLGGVLDADRFAYVAVAAVFLSVARPQFGGGPKYEDLVVLLESKSKQFTKT